MNTFINLNDIPALKLEKGVIHGIRFSGAAADNDDILCFKDAKGRAVGIRVDAEGIREVYADDAPDANTQPATTPIWKRG